MAADAANFPTPREEPEIPAGDDSADPPLKKGFNFRPYDEREPGPGPSLVKARERHAKAIQMRIEGFDYQQIADTLGYASPAAAAAGLRRGMRNWGSEHAEDLRAIMGSQIDDVLRGVFPLARVGELEAVDRFVKLIDLKAKLFGVQVHKSEVMHKGNTPGSQQVIVVQGDGKAYVQALMAVEKQIAGQPLELEAGNGDPDADAEDAADAEFEEEGEIVDDDEETDSQDPEDGSQAAG